MKFHILFPFKAAPWGGGNQALHALRQALSNKGYYSDTMAEADVFVFNSHHNLPTVWRTARQYPRAIFLHRVDGPVTLIRQRDDGTDRLIFQANLALANGTIFQSEWSRQQNRQRFPFGNKPSCVALNAPDTSIFRRRAYRQIPENAKTKLIAASWSANWRKGFQDYQWLDKNLNFSQISFTFVGNAPIRFSHIDMLPPQDSHKLAKILAESDIFLTGSEKDPCSNALIEAMAVGLPAIARRDGGHPEIVGKGGMLYDDVDETPALISRLRNDYGRYQANLPLRHIDDVVAAYLSVAERCRAAPISVKSLIQLQALWFKWKLMSKFNQFKQQLING